jgi:Iron/manganese superoxide dismutases, C-terminal domain
MLASVAGEKRVVHSSWGSIARRHAAMTPSTPLNLGHTRTGRPGRAARILLAYREDPSFFDMYEHAYHMDYGAAAARYVDAFMVAIRWDDAVNNYDRYARES